MKIRLMYDYSISGLSDQVNDFITNDQPNINSVQYSTCQELVPDGSRIVYSVCILYTILEKM
jgi:hypothetical protein